MTMFRMPAMIAIQMIPHVQQLFGNNHFQGHRPTEVDALQIDQDGMATRLPEIAIRAPVGGGDPTSEPAAVETTIRRHMKRIYWKREAANILLDQWHHALVTMFQM
jgi:hypothetical protein